MSKHTSKVGIALNYLDVKLDSVSANQSCLFCVGIGGSTRSQRKAYTVERESSETGQCCYSVC